jgi:hypothetical protein
MRRLLRALLVLPLLSLWLGARDLREDELRCEEGVAQLVQCCPDFNADAVDCTYTPPGCEGAAIEPAISEDEAQQLFSDSCDEIRAKGECTRMWLR